MIRYYILEGKTPRRTDLMTWARWECEHPENRRVAWTVVGRTHVSTIFLGFDHRMFRVGPPQLFETMIFGGPMDEVRDRYATYDEADAGHTETVERVAEAQLAEVEKT